MTGRSIGLVIALWLAVILIGAIAVIALTGPAHSAVPREASPGQPIDVDDGPPVSPAQTEREFQRAQGCRRALGLPVWQTQHHWRIMVGREYRAWLHALWHKRANECEAQLERANRDVRYAIRLIFRGPGDSRYAYDAPEQAVRVAWCESRWTTWDKLGQYEGVFQMGANERAQYGVGAYQTVVEQVRSGWRMFVAAGRSWSRWQCRPGSGGETSYSLGW